MIKHYLKNIGKAVLFPKAGCLPKPTHIEPGLITFHNNDFLHEAKFSNALNAARKSTGEDLPGVWRTYTAAWFGKYCQSLPGDFVEFGVDKGFTSYVVMHYGDFNDCKKTYWLMDTFEGLDISQMSKKEIEIVKPSRYKYGGNYENIKSVFKAFKKCKAIKGSVPGSLNKITSKRICFAYIDMNNVYPEIEAAKFVWDRMPKGGVILLDDYAFSEKYIMQKEAFDVFAKERKTSVLTLSNGLGLIMK